MCRSGADFGGCGKIAITATPLEELIADAVLYRLDSPELARSLDGKRQDDADSAALSETIATDTAQLDELAAMFGNREITAPEWRAAREPVEARLTANRRRQASNAGTPVLAGFIGNSQTLLTAWPTLDLSQQAGIVRAIVDHISINPGTLGAQRLDPSRVEVRWRL